MRTSLLSLALAVAVEATGAPHAKNFIYVVPDGYGTASQVMARDYYSIINGEGTSAAPNSAQIGADSIVRLARHPRESRADSIAHGECSHPSVR